MRRESPIEFLRTGDFLVSFKWLDRYTKGKIDYDRRTIEINLDLVIAEIFLHEFLHHEDQMASELEVIRRMRRLMTRLTVRQILNIAEEVSAFALSEEETAE